jgi:hypothetical protein
MSFGFEPRQTPGSFRRAYPFRKSWPAIAVIAVLDGVFLWPAVFTFRQAAAEWSRLDSLFDLVGALFLSAWLTGWSMAPLLLTGILLMMLFGREVVIARRGGQLELFLGIRGLGLTGHYEVDSMRNLRFERPPPKSGKSWRGPHFLFDYGANSVAFGSNVAGDSISELRSRIETASGVAIRRGEARPQELEGEWAKSGLKAILAASATDEAETAGIEPAGSAPGDRGELRVISPSTLLLIAANLVPLAGAAFLGWNLADVMVLYWAESAVIGLFNMAKIIVIGRWAALLAVPFFAGHFGGFMAVHFLFIYTLFIEGPGNSSSGDLAEVARLFLALWPALLALFLSHGFSFVQNFLGRGEYRARTVKKQMTEPYSRIVFMHLVLIFGGGLTLILGGATPVLVAVIILKIVFDVRSHLKERRSVGAVG